MHFRQEVRNAMQDFTKRGERGGRGGQGQGGRGRVGKRGGRGGYGRGGRGSRGGRHSSAETVNWRFNGENGEEVAETLSHIEIRSFNDHICVRMPLSNPTFVPVY
ncbi:hypothetical protein EV356DRAFT_519900 [Viridothelium virens]|uniref:Uncharacterized protein n=1 Tax=Viridothelium virens TaxID=1048519 RepID=A0A6A6GXB1_VIRVR|nr:hypothetical protein EV356DRAFT_519900 [Viridothelium virens]